MKYRFLLVSLVGVQLGLLSPVLAQSTSVVTKQYDDGGVY
jgi:hypothetical protein